MKIVARASLALFLAFLTVLIAGPATAVTVPSPGSPNPVNILPSTIVGATQGITGNAKLDVQMALLYKYGKDASFWNAVAANAAGTATPTQIATINTEKSTFRIPATKLEPLARGVGVGATVISGYSFGTMIGGGVLDLIGFDRTGAVCTQTSGAIQTMVGILTGTDCSEFNEFQEDLVANMGVVPGLLGGSSCNAEGLCATLTALETGVYQGNAGQRACFGLSGGTVSGNLSIGYWLSTNNLDGNPNSSLAVRPGSWDGNTCSNPLYGLFVSGSLVKYVIQVGTGAVPFTPSMTSANPTRTLKCVVLGSDSNTYTAVSESYTEADGVLPTPNCPDLPAGVDALSVKVYETVNGEDTLLSEQDVTPEYQEHQSEFPECADGTCMLDLRSTATGSCFQVPASCLDWFADPNKESKYSCWYGTHAVSLAECNLYAPSFKPENGTQGNVYGDPENGNPQTAPPGANPGVDKDTFGATTQDPTGQRQCFPTGWGVLNPVEWVTKPVQCALQWAFVPRPSVVTASTTAMQESIGELPPSKIIAAAAAWEFIPPGSGCDGITITLFFLPDPLQIAPACPGDMFEPLAFWSRVFGNLVFTIYGVVAVTRNLARIVEYPGLGSEG